ncbi:hypothetical protein ccbrp13_30750 [Ktedonobacteria bacterium brp13]|nr:hypothetical protein ccbrp13_30750 [Ktedonobacteria bacterium brp13]
MEKFDNIHSAAEIDEHIERLAHAENGDLPLDAPEIQVIRALQEYYQPDELDQHSIDRTWTRLVHLMSTTDVVGEEPTTLVQSTSSDILRRFGHGKLRPHIPQRPWWKSLSTLIVLAMAFLLIGSAISVFSMTRVYMHKPTPSSVTMTTPTKGTTARLGTSIGGVALGMNLNQVMNVYPAAKLNVYQVRSGPISITVEKNASTYVVVHISVSVMNSSMPQKSSMPQNSSLPQKSSMPQKSSFATVEGLRLGDSSTTMHELYPQFVMKRTTLSPGLQAKNMMYVATIHDDYDTTLQVMFNTQNRAVEITLQKAM